MTDQEKDRIECAIRHIQTAVDVDPWAVDIAVEAMEKEISALQAQDSPKPTAESVQNVQDEDLILRKAAIDAVIKRDANCGIDSAEVLKTLPSTQPEIVRCKDCKHWRQQTNYQGAPLSFGFCESDGMWRSLYGETCEVSHIDTDDDHYCGYAERKDDV